MHLSESCQRLVIVHQEPKGGLLVVQAGDPASLACTVWDFEEDPEDGVSSTPLTWTREGATFRDGSHSFQGRTYSIDEAGNQDAGFYYCTATSIGGKPI